MEKAGTHIAHDVEEFAVRSNAGDWLTAWHSPIEVPAGTPHGANAFCVTEDDQVVLISNDGVHWGWAGDRPEGSESWEQTLRREILEETCSIVTRGSSGFAKVCASVIRRRIASWSALYGARKSSCCHGTHVSRSGIDGLFPRMSCS